ncbi:MAG: hypothetical protein ACFE9D_08465 [Promethearchaeota archaeon]
MLGYSGADGEIWYQYRVLLIITGLITLFVTGFLAGLLVIIGVLVATKPTE